jgi:hypothetical protein
MNNKTYTAAEIIAEIEYLRECVKSIRLMDSIFSLHRINKAIFKEVCSHYSVTKDVTVNKNFEKGTSYKSVSITIGCDADSFSIYVSLFTVHTELKPTKFFCDHDSSFNTKHLGCKYLGQNSMCYSPRNFCDLKVEKK